MVSTLWNYCLRYTWLTLRRLRLCTTTRNTNTRQTIYIRKSHLFPCKYFRLDHRRRSPYTTNLVHDLILQAQLSVPINEITHLEKKMTAFVIPNGIQVTTRQNKYTFASFLSRDTTFDVIHNIWKLERPDDASISSVGRGSFDAPSMHAPSADQGVSSPSRKATTCVCGKEGKHLVETALETVVPGTPEKIYSLIFASGFMKDFMSVNQKLMGACFVMSSSRTSY